MTDHAYKSVRIRLEVTVGENLADEVIYGAVHRLVLPTDPEYAEELIRRAIANVYERAMEAVKKDVNP